ncbi:myosin-binding protein 1 [Vigna radiata var. radiata]|uniref:Myosin-binding protein 1 n=1 Tax=Vigna radiata var. radiata TaxID=3916 RepID=A0A1S3TCW9_VIGRR|nr:myosin-binding protein 1 [Vigna radiata var. radiata]XP_014491611.1 myosin-binding protein 1 [Vigna radiata var. radiata]
MMATAGISSSECRKRSPSVTMALASAFLEWLLIFLLFIDAAFSYVITKFASYCKLQTPCLFCSRLDHVLGKERKGYYWNLICSGHKTEISSVVLCRAHDKLVNVQGMCESCLFSFATVNKSNAETYRLLVGKLGEGSESRFDQDPLLGENESVKLCSCCNEQWTLKSHDRRSVTTKSIGSGGVEFDVSNVVGNNFQKKRAKSFVYSRGSRLRNKRADPLSHVGYTELKVTSDTDSEQELSLSDDGGTSIPVRGTYDSKKDIEVPCEHMEFPILDLNENLASEKLGTSSSELQPALPEPGMQLENKDTRGSKYTAAIPESRNGVAEFDSQQQIERNAVSPAAVEPISCDEVPALSNKTGVPVELAKENYDLTTDEVSLKSKQTITTDYEEIIESVDKPTTSEAGLESTTFSNDIGQQNPNLLDLGDAYKLAVSNRGRPGMLVEHWLGKDSTRISEDLKMLLSQFSSTRGTDLSVNDIISPRLSMNSDEVKNSDVSNSAGMQILQRMISLERNESGLSLDGSIVSEIEGESAVDRLKRQVDHDRKLLNALYKELEEERNASAVAANQALAMITRLQEEKATLHMEALQYLRMMDEQSEYETEAFQKANDLLVEKEKEIEELQAKLEFYRKKFPDELVPENMVEINSEMKVKEIGLDHCIEKDEIIHGKSVTENTDISDKVEVLPILLEKQNIQSEKSLPLEFQDERLYISQRLEKLEKQVYLFLNIHQSRDNWINSQNDENESLENLEKLDNNILMDESVASLKLNSDDKGDDSSSKEPLVCKKSDEIGYNGHSPPVPCGNNGLSSTHSLTSDFLGRLQVLESDLNFLKHSINLSSNGEEGLKLLREIADHLQQLRQVGIRELDQPVA